MNKLLGVALIALLPLASIGALSVGNGGGATNITSTSAWITASIVSTGAANPFLFSYWGTNSGGTNVASWGHTNAYGASAQGSYSFKATNLTGSTIYYFRTYASNSSATAWSTYAGQFVTLTTPTSAPPSSAQTVTVDTNDVLKHPTNFFVVNSNSIKTAIGFSGDTDSNAVWGNITGTLANQLDLTDTVFKATSASQPGHKQDWASITNVPAFDHTALTNQQGNISYQHITTAQVALVNVALQPGAAGTSTNLSEYNNDVPFLTNETLWTAVSNSVVYTNNAKLLASITNESLWQGASNSVVYTNDSRYLAALTNNPGWITNETLWIASSNDVLYKTDTNGWVVSAHSAWITNEALWVADSNNVVYKSDTNGWTITAHQAWITNEFEWEANSNKVVYTNDNRITLAITNNPGWLTNEPLWITASNGIVYQDMTNGWVVASHAGLATGTPVYAESDPVWAGKSNSVVYTNDPALTDARAWNAPNYNTITNPPTIPTNAAQVGAATTAQMAEVQGRTNTWNTAATDATAATNDVVALKNATNNLNTRVTLVTTQLFAGADTTGRITSAAGDAGKFLKADGAWGTPAGAGDFKADGSVPMTGNLNGGGQRATNFVNLVYTNDPALTDARAPLTHDQGWTTITGTPTTVAGYGITDGATGTPVYAESDPVWKAASNTVVYSNNVNLFTTAEKSTATNAFQKNGGTLSGGMTNIYGYGMGTNSITMFGGVLNGTNGVYWTCGTNDYWILFQ